MPAVCRRGARWKAGSDPVAGMAHDHHDHGPANFDRAFIIGIADELHHRFAEDHPTLQIDLAAHSHGCASPL